MSKLALSIGAAVLIVAAAVAWHAMGRLRVNDTQFFVAAEAAKLVAAHPDATEADIHAAAGAELRRLEKASVTSAWFDASGQLVDPWGSRFLITVDLTPGAAVATCTSAGPDRRAGTWDDIVEVHSEPIVGQANPALQPTGETPAAER